MASQVLDVITRFTYDVDNSDLNESVNALQKQVASVVNYAQRVDRLETALAKSAANDTQRRQRLTALINQNRQAAEGQNQAIQKTIASNKQLQDAITKEIGLINLLNSRISALKDARNSAGTEQQIRGINKELSTLEGQLSRLQSSGGKNIIGNIGNGILQGLGLSAGLGIAAGVGQIKQFVEASGELAKESEGVSRAFQNLNQPDLLDNLRAATKGTVSDLELMKKAIQFSNFGLPVEKLGIAFEFARRRAKDTGESVEFLVQSIVTGIGRQSPLILDNLGINAKRVRDEFQKIGNFSEAAFKIIQEESAKAGEDLESFAETEARITAEIENQQVTLGKFFNEAKGFYIALGQDILQAFSPSSNEDVIESNVANYVKLQKRLRAAKDEQVQANTQADVLYLQNFQRFSADFAQADFKGRDKVRQQANESFATLSAQARDYYKNDANNLTIYLQGLRQAYQRFTQGVKATPINLNTLSTQSLRGLSASQLNDLKDQIGLAGSSLTRSDGSTIEKYRQLNAAIEAELKLLDVTPSKTGKAGASAEKYKKQLEDLKNALLEFAKANREIDKEYEAESKRLDDLQKKREAANRETLDAVGRSVTNDIESREGRNPNLVGQENVLEETVRKNAEDRKKRTGVSKAEDVKAAKQKENIDIVRAAYVGLQTVLETINGLYAQQQQLLDVQFSNQQERVRQAEVLAERGNTTELKAEQEKLDGIAAKREEVARKQVALNGLLQASNAALALTDALLVVTNAGKTGDPYSTAARIAAAVAALAAGFSLVAGLSSLAKGFAHGGYTGEGGKYDVAGQVHKGEFVFTKEKTAQFRPLFEAIHTGKVKDPSYFTQGSGMSTRGIERGLKDVRSAIEDNKVGVYTNIRDGQFMQMVERVQRNNFRRKA